jgi:hypothetical protein
MNLSYIQGFIEFYSVDQYGKVEEAVHALKDRNFFNIVLARKFADNHGSIIIPFAKSFRSDESDKEFLNKSLNELVAAFVDIGSFCIDFILDVSENRSLRFYALFDGNHCSISYSLPVVPQTKTATVELQKDKIDINFIE